MKLFRTSKILFLTNKVRGKIGGETLKNEVCTHFNVIHGEIYNLTKGN